MTGAVLSLLERDIERLKEEIKNYQKEEDLWKLAGQISNTPGNLCLHLVGNLNYFIGGVLGHTGYVRDRDAEFRDKYIKKEILMAMVDDTGKLVKQVLGNFDDHILSKTYPLKVFGEEMSTGYFLIHLCTHLNYHLGQINYHRRILGSVSSAD